MILDPNHPGLSTKARGLLVSFNAVGLYVNTDLTDLPPQRTSVSILNSGKKDLKCFFRDKEYASNGPGGMCAVEFGNDTNDALENLADRVIATEGETGECLAVYDETGYKCYKQRDNGLQLVGEGPLH